MNVLFGNISLKKGFRLSRLEDGGTLWGKFKGPRFGREGLRALLGVPHRPLLSTAVKPMGLPAEELALLAGRFAAGGIDIIKDDHGLANQPFAASRNAPSVAPRPCAKFRSPDGPYHSLCPQRDGAGGRVFMSGARFAKQLGAGALLVCPGLTGSMPCAPLADDDSLDCPSWPTRLFSEAS